ncbi:MAG: class I SAM-dependent methyltransferase [Marinilabiliaceae bacterium]|nr:class I SAM-dependent methyltransferase [Marinilabiliaceae bacterium]
MTVCDLGCGPGFFSLEMAQLVSASGKVIAVDMQEVMLDRIMKKVAGTKLEQRIVLHQCEDKNVGVTEKVDFVLAFYMIHEVPDQETLFNELISILKPNGLIFIIEPKFHVSKQSFNQMIAKLEAIGLKIIERPKVFFSRAIVLKYIDN